MKRKNAEKSCTSLGMPAWEGITGCCIPRAFNNGKSVVTYPWSLDSASDLKSLNHKPGYEICEADLVRKFLINTPVSKTQDADYQQFLAKQGEERKNFI